MKIDRLILGAFETNCYVLGADESAGEGLVIDPGLEAGHLIAFLQQRRLNPVAAILTHGHADHIVGLELLRKNFPQIRVYVHELDSAMLTGEQPNLSEMTGRTFRTGAPDFRLQQGSLIDAAGIRLEVLHTPGHTPGGISLYSRGNAVVFTGDALFAGSVGRTDFPGGNMTQLVAAIKERLFTLPDETVVYPGHGPATTIGQEKAHNPFLG